MGEISMRAYNHYPAITHTIMDTLLYMIAQQVITAQRVALHIPPHMRAHIITIAHKTVESKSHVHLVRRYMIHIELPWVIVVLAQEDIIAMAQATHHNIAM